MTVVTMKRVCCASTSCPGRRKHHENPEPRGLQYFWVDETTEGPYYCSIECSIYGQHEAAIAVFDDESPSAGVNLDKDTDAIETDNRGDGASAVSDDNVSKGVE